MHEPSIDTLTPERFRRIRDLFEGALDRAPEERRAFIEIACGSDTALRTEVERMLEVEDAKASCSSCGATMAADDRFCRACGTPAAGRDDREGRFRAGALFAGRFRIVARLGRGGMGEVYRAEDLELGQPVALKFLTAFRSDERARARLRTEVRLARQIAHPNVCRVYDFGEASGELYVSMEYVDGEDLAALLKRIGRLPIDKGLEIARKLCGGLAAAHSKGVLHRDFKPANIMIDGRGEIRILDFGLAATAEQGDAADVRSGTPAYMAPEQLAGREATAHSDIYALGLVLYELFTGKPPFQAKTVQEFLRLREESAPTKPSTLIPELSERVEHAILRCLDHDPSLRPGSPLHVSAVLPGGDPLAEALAAGETPSPEMVAAAGVARTSTVRAAFTMLMCVVVGAIGIGLLTWKTHTLGMVPLDNSPETLCIRARDIIRNLGYTERPADFAFGFQNDDYYLDSVRATVTGSLRSRVQQWRQRLAVSPSPVLFWYRQGPTPLVVESPVRGPDYKVSLTDPFPERPNMIAVVLELDGRLQHFAAIPPSDTRPNANPTPPDWSQLFSAARLDIARFKPTMFESSALVVSDARQAWIGSHINDSDVPVRVEAAALHGRVTQFDVRFPWTPPTPSPPLPFEPWPLRVSVINLLLIAVVALLAHYNVTANRADIRGGWRVASFFAILIALRWILAVHHGPARWVLFDLLERLIPSLFYVSAASGLAYLAIEPWVRRYWPQIMITWSRFLAGRWRDPDVGRDVLVGVIWAIVHTLLQRISALGELWLGATPPRPTSTVVDWGVYLQTLMGSRVMSADVLFFCGRGFLIAAQLSFTVLFFRALLRRRWLAVAASFILLFVGSVGDRSHLVFDAISISIALLVLLRHGLLATTVFAFVMSLTDSALLTLDVSAWYGQGSLVALIVVIATAIWGARVSLGDQSLAGSLSR